MADAIVAPCHGVCCHGRRLTHLVASLAPSPSPQWVHVGHYAVGGEKPQHIQQIPQVGPAASNAPSGASSWCCAAMLVCAGSQCSDPRFTSPAPPPLHMVPITLQGDSTYPECKNKDAACDSWAGNGEHQRPGCCARRFAEHLATLSRAGMTHDSACDACRRRVREKPGVYGGHQAAPRPLHQGLWQVQPLLHRRRRGGVTMQLPHAAAAHPLARCGTGAAVAGALPQLKTNEICKFFLSHLPCVLSLTISVLQCKPPTKKEVSALSCCPPASPPPAHPLCACGHHLAPLASQTARGNRQRWQPESPGSRSMGQPACDGSWKHC